MIKYVKANAVSRKPIEITRMVGSPKAVLEALNFTEIFPNVYAAYHDGDPDRLAIVDLSTNANWHCVLSSRNSSRDIAAHYYEYDSVADFVQALEDAGAWCDEGNNSAIPVDIHIVPIRDGSGKLL